MDAIATSTEATRELWRYLFGVDLIAQGVAVELRPGDAALPHGEGRPQAPAEARRRHLAAARGRRRGAAAALVRGRRLGRARGDGRVLLRGTRAVTAPARTRARPRTPPSCGCRLPTSRPRTSARSRSSGWPRPAGWRSSPRARSHVPRRSSGPRCRRTAREAVLVAIKVRTCKTLAEFKQAIGAIAEYGGWEIDDEIAKRFSACFRSTTCTRPSRAGARSAARARSLRHVRSGRLRALRGRHRRRRLPDAPAAGDPHRDDARPARRRARARASRSRRSGPPTSGSTAATATAWRRSRARSSCPARTPSSRLRSKTLALFATSRATTCRRCSGRSGSTSSASGRECSRARPNGGARVA